MKKITLLLTLVCATLLSCSSKKQLVPTGSKSLEGNWELTYITGPKIAFDGLYPNEKPNITFNISNNLAMGKNSCNSYTGNFKAEGNKISFGEGMASTKMFCDGQGESTYMSALQEIDSFTITNEGKTLNLLKGDVEMMRFERKYAVRH